MSASQGGESSTPSTPPFRKLKAATVAGGGTAVTTLIISGALPLALMILGIIMVGIFAVVAIVVLKDDGKSTRFDRLMCLLGMLFGRPATRFLPKQAVEKPPCTRPASILPLQAAPPGIDDGGIHKPNKEDAA